MFANTLHVNNYLACAFTRFLKGYGRLLVCSELSCIVNWTKKTPLLFITVIS